jgi:hypothetical protein
MTLGCARVVSSAVAQVPAAQVTHCCTVIPYNHCCLQAACSCMYDLCKAWGSAESSIIAVRQRCNAHCYFCCFTLLLITTTIVANRVDRSECLQAANAAAQQQAHRGVDDILRITKSIDQMSLLPSSSSSANGCTTVNGSSSSQQQHHRLTGGSSIAGAVHVSEEDDSESDTDTAADTADADEVSYSMYIHVNACSQESKVRSYVLPRSNSYCSS